MYKIIIFLHFAIKLYNENTDLKLKKSIWSLILLNFEIYFKQNKIIENWNQ
jgi:hypothetical protein